MRAAVISGPGAVEVTTVGDPTPGAGEVIIDVATVGICGTDLHILDGTAGGAPVVPGHEFAGEVVALGAEVSGLSVGDRVAVDPNLPCRACRPCRRGRSNLCEHYRALGVTTDGGAAEYTSTPATNCVVLPPSIELGEAALIEPLSCVVHALDVLGGRAGERFLVYGAGTIGLMTLSLARRAGAASVDVVEVNHDRFDAARQLGARHVETAADEMAVSGGWDVVLDCTGAVAAIEDGLANVARGGTFLQVGVAPDDAVVSIAPARIYRDELTIVGSMAVLHSFGRAVELYADGAIPGGTLVTHRRPLDEYPQAIEDVRRGVGRKTVLVP